MLTLQKISMGRVRQAYALNTHEANSLIQALCPQAVFPLELWYMAYERFWKDFARAEAMRQKVECPVLPDIVLETGKGFHTDLCGFDVMAFFRKLSLRIDFKIVKMGLEYILSETFETFDTVFPEERDFLFSTLQKLAQRGPNYHMFDIENIDDELLCLPFASYHFIAHIFTDTILVDRAAAIFQLRDYPLRQEVKGITRAFVASILNPLAEETADAIICISQPQVQTTAPRSTGSKKDYDRIKATRQVCKEVAEELHKEKQSFEGNNENWKQNLLFDNGKTNWKTFISTVELRLCAKPHHDTAREEWNKVSGTLKHNGRMREQ